MFGLDVDDVHKLFCREGHPNSQGPLFRNEFAGGFGEAADWNSVESILLEVFLSENLSVARRSLWEIVVE